MSVQLSDQKRGICAPSLNGRRTSKRARPTVHLLSVRRFVPASSFLPPPPAGPLPRSPLPIKRLTVRSPRTSRGRSVRRLSLTGAAPGKGSKTQVKVYIRRCIKLKSQPTGQLTKIRAIFSQPGTSILVHRQSPSKSVNSTQQHEAANSRDQTT